MTLINGTQVYRELGDPPQVLINWLDERGQLWNVLDDHQNEHLYVENETPRDSDITPMIVECTIGFSLFDEDGKRLADYSRLDKALRAQEGAKRIVIPEVELEDQIELPEDAEPALSAAEAALQEKIDALTAQIAEQADEGEIVDEDDD